MRGAPNNHRHGRSLPRRSTFRSPIRLGFFFDILVLLQSNLHHTRPWLLNHASAGPASGRGLPFHNNRPPSSLRSPVSLDPASSREFSAYSLANTQADEPSPVFGASDTRPSRPSVTGHNHGSTEQSSNAKHDSQRAIADSKEALSPISWAPDDSSERGEPTRHPVSIPLQGIRSRS